MPLVVLDLIGRPQDLVGAIVAVRVVVVEPVPRDSLAAVADKIWTVVVLVIVAALEIESGFLGPLPDLFEGCVSQLLDAALKGLTH